MRRRELLAGMGAGAVASLGGCLGSIQVPGSEVTSWRQFQYDGANPYNPDAGGVPDGVAVQWRTDTWGLETASVVVGDTVYVGSGNLEETLYAYEIGSSEPKRHVPMPGGIQREIAADGDGVYVVTPGRDRELRAYGAAGGKEQWSQSDVNGFAIDGEQVYATMSGLTAFEKGTGDREWSRDIRGGLPAVHDGTVYVTSSEGAYGLDTTSGETVWSSSVETSLHPTVTDRHVYLQNQGAMIATAVEDGETVWELPGRFASGRHAIGEELGFFVGTHRGQEGNPQPGVHAVDVESGEREWTWAYEDGEFLRGHAALAGETLYVSTPYRLLAFDPASGDRRWWMQFQWPVGPPVIVDETIVLPVGGRVYTIEDGSGTDGVWPLQADHVPDRETSGSDPAYAGVDRYFGTPGYDVAHDVSVEVPDEAPFDLAVEVRGDTITDDTDVEIEIVITNGGEDTLEWSHAQAMPFGPLRLEDDEHAIMPWSPRYAENRHVHTIARKYLSTNAIGSGSSVSPGETLSEIYTVSAKTHEVRPGTYERALGVIRINPHEVDLELTLEITPTAEEDETVVADLAIADRVALPDDIRGVFDVEVIEPVRAGHPGVIEVRFDPGRGGRVVHASSGWPLASYIGHGPDGKRLVLIPENMYAPGWIERTNGGWWTSRLLPPEVLYRTADDRDSDSATGRRYIVTGHPDTEPPASGDSYVFEQGYEEGQPAVTWGFTLAVL